MTGASTGTPLARRVLASAGSTLLALVLVGVVARARLAPPAETTPHPPLGPEEAGQWLRAQAASAAADRWALLDAHPEVARWYRGAFDPGTLPVDARLAISRARWPVGMRGDLAAATGLQPDAAVLLLDPPWANAVAEGTCSNAGFVPLPELCATRRAQAEQAVDAWVGAQLAAGGPTATRLLDAMPDLGPRGAQAARGVLATSDDAARARALLALSWAAPDSAPDTLVQALSWGPLARLVAAVELGRLEQREADDALAALQAELTGTGDAVLVAYARWLASGEDRSVSTHPGL